MVGAKSGILTAKHGCGFFLWPTNITLPSGENYGYHIGNSGLGIDLVGLYAKEMDAAGLKHSYYYSFKDSFFLNALDSTVRTLEHTRLNLLDRCWAGRVAPFALG